MTESTAMACLLPPSIFDYGTVGCPVPSAELKLVDGTSVSLLYPQDPMSSFLKSSNLILQFPKLVTNRQTTLLRENSGFEDLQFVPVTVSTFTYPKHSCFLNDFLRLQTNKSSSRRKHGLKMDGSRLVMSLNGTR